MGIKELNNAKIPLVKINTKLEQFTDKILFPKKVKLANSILKKATLPTFN